MVKLGQIQKPNADDYIGKKKLYCVANIFAVGEADDEYKKLVRKYWDEVAQQIEKIEAAGKVNKIFCELISESDAEELKFITLITDRLAEIITRKKEDGGKLIPLEDKEILGPYTDWGNCLSILRQACHLLYTNPATHCTAKLPPIVFDFCHLFSGKVAT